MNVRSLVLPYQARMTDTLGTKDDDNSDLCSLKTPADTQASGNLSFMSGVLARYIPISPRPSLQTLPRSVYSLPRRALEPIPVRKAGKRSLTSDGIVIFATSGPFLRIELIRKTAIHRTRFRALHSLRITTIRIPSSCLLFWSSFNIWPI